MDYLPVDNKSRKQLLEPLPEHLNWDNGQPEHTCDWNYLTVHTFVSCTQFFGYLNL
jgi:hypothetical protein